MRQQAKSPIPGQGRYPVKRYALLVLAAGLVAAADAPKDDTAKKDLKNLEGTWTLSSGVDDGKKVPEKTLSSAKLVIAGDRHTVTVGEQTYKGTHKLGSAGGHKTIDITDTEGPFAGKTVLGIYELEGDNFKISYAPPGQDRPKDFTAKAGSGQHAHVWKREKK
jgi:uncharacterized protein (TIGR03067 family)